MNAKEPDEEPPIIAVLDEAAPADRRGIYYVVTAAIMLDVDAVRRGLAEVVPADRTRPFHWSAEGPRARTRMVELLIETGVVAHVVVHYPTGRRRQEEARRNAMVELVPLVVADGAAELIIESRSEREDQRDRQSVIEAMRLAEHTIRYRWEPKSESLLWVADAVCGAVKEYVLHEDGSWLGRLELGAVLSELRYRTLG
ncbi:MAG: hypothetical protein EDR02_14460 [Actinobacteria bacterium]|nr:MAG: hypothetical protein EDR02_14460 [Actinomycetota bacterium]RIK06318.1 MAG: hypothetical protein DCC48_07790 [Acidobacteriota bacterium]